jgi:hypothetical protein
MNTENRLFIAAVSIILMCASVSLSGSISAYTSEVAMYNFFDVIVIFTMGLVMMFSGSVGILMFLYSALTH